MTFLLASLAFFTSGFAALVYQIVWQRLLVLPLGADVYSTTITVAAFMAGLGLGSLAGAFLADRLTWFQNLLMFVAAELAVGAFGFLSRLVFYDWGYLHLGSTPMHPFATVAMVFASLVWPTFWMGMSLPLLGRAVSDGIAGAPKRVGVLYGLNTLGAAFGAFTTTWVLFPHIGLDGAIRVAAAANLLAAVAVLAIAAPAWRRARTFDRLEPDVSAPRDEGVATGWSFRTWAMLYGVAGFQALSLEIVWFRLLGVMLKSSAFTFGTLLTIYLAGLGLGAALASFSLRNVRRPAMAFLWLQAFVGLYAGISITLLVSMLRSSSTLPTLAGYVAGYEPLDAASAFANLWRPGSDAAASARFLRLYVVLPAILVGPPTIAMGASFPLLQKVVLLDLGHVGRRVGLVMIANIAGSALGSILTGWVALTWFGSAATLKGLTAISGLFLALAAIAGSGRRSVAWRAAFAACAVAAVAVVTLRMPDGLTLWASLHGSPPQWILYAEDASGLSLLKSEPRVFGNRVVVFVNGIGQSWIPYGNIHTVLGALPAFLHPNPREAALIGLGSGDTLFALAGRPELSRITSIEIIRPQLATLKEWEQRSGYPALSAVLSDPRITHVYGDGRIYIMRSGRSFDIIEADALRPTSAYAGNLYSVGYFELLRSHLAPGGLAVTWAPTSRIHETFVQVFPHVLSFGDIVFGSDQPIRFNPEAIRARMRMPAAQKHYGRAGVDIESLLAPYLAASPRTIDRSERPPVEQGVGLSRDANEDLFPRDEFSVPRP